MTTHELAKVDEVEPGDSKVVEVGNRELCLFNVGGEYHVLPNRCPHQQAPLCNGVIGGTVVADVDTGFRPEWDYDGEVVTCPWHDLMFRIPTGECLEIAEMSLPSYDVTVEGDSVVVEV
ncbi:MAG: Rieske (2Fe-2S) protein [Halobacteriota archaeon]